MALRTPTPLRRGGLAAFRRLPRWARRRVVRAATPHFTVGAVLLVVDEAGRVLMVRQRHSRGWALPGGLLARGETPEEAVVREVGEELGLRVDPGRLTPAVPNASVDPQARRVDMIYTLHGTPDVAIDGIDVFEARWFPRDALPPCPGNIYRAVERHAFSPPAP